MFPVMDFVKNSLLSGVGPSQELQGNKPNCCHDVLINQLFYKGVKISLIAESYKIRQGGSTPSSV